MSDSVTQIHIHPHVLTRIGHRFPERFTEWLFAVIMCLWGTTMFIQPDLFERNAWTVFEAIFGDEAVLGSIMIFIGLMRLTSLFINGARKKLTPVLRMAGAFFGMGVWMFISLSFLLSGVISTWIAVYPMFAVAELFNSYRAARDGGKANA